MRFLITALFALLLVACGPKPDENSVQRIQPKVIEAKGYVVPKDSMAPPVVVQVDESKLTKIPAGEPKVVPIDTNVHLAGEPKVLEVGAPRICIPGQDTFAMPVPVPAIDSTYAVGIPEVVIAKDADIIEINSVSFSALTSKQGLLKGEIKCLAQDKKGNLWYGTEMGVGKYDGKCFTHYSEKQGIRNPVNSILEDKKGNLWFGTWGGGAIKYSGKTFTKFTKGQGLIDNDVFSIIEDRTGNLWFATKGGVSKFNGESFTHFTTKEGLSSNDVRSVFEDSRGNIWFSYVRSKGFGVCKFDGNSFSNYSDIQGLNSNYITSFFEDKTGVLWFASLDGLSKFDGERFTNYGEEEGLMSRFLNSITQDYNGNLWIGTWDGITKYDGLSFTHYSDREGNDYNWVNSILSDCNGNVWFGMKGGILKYGGSAFKHFTEVEGLSVKKVKSIYEDEIGSLWFCGFGEHAKFDGKSFMNSVVPSANCVAKDKFGNLWFGTGNGAIRFDGEQVTHFTEREGLCKWWIHTVQEDKSGNIWFIPYGEGIYKYDGKSFTHLTENQGLINDDVKSIMSDNSGNIWFGTRGGVSKYDGSLFTNYSVKEGLSDNQIYSILEDKSGNIWFGTGHGGVIKFDGNYFTHYDERVGMSTEFIYGLCQDRKGNMYFGSRYDLKFISEENLKELDKKIASGTVTESEGFFREIGVEDGFLSEGINEGEAIVEDRNGTIWIGSSERLTAYSPSSVVEDTLAPNIQLTGIDLFNEPIAWHLLTGKQDSTLVLKNGMHVSDYAFSDVSRWYSIPENLSLAYNNNYITFNFIGITLNQPKLVKYQYKLEGMDENWSGITSRNEATYGNLPHGTYTFLVKAMNSEGVWSEPFQYTFTIRPPWWKTWWAYGLYVLIGLASISSYLRWRDRIAIKRRKVLQQKVTEATAEIRLQKEEVEKQKQRSDELLLNILPEQVAEELKERGEAEAKLMDNVTVLFTDFKGFTQLSEKLTPQELVSQIHEYFSAFDAIVVKYGIEKIKTIGDAYMAAGGLPEMNETHAHDVIMAAIEINAYMLAQRQKRQASGEPYFEIRIGIHTGPVVAGIVGVKKFQYDIWGDTVNSASRMESAGEPGKINISESTYELIKDRFVCEYRGEIEAKGKGKMKMYFVSDGSRA